MRHDRPPHDSPGSEESLERFVVSASPQLLRVAFVLTGDRGEAEDLLQGALVRLVGRWHLISASPGPYVLQVLVNLSRDRHRRLGRRPRETADAHPVERFHDDEAGRLMDRDALAQAVRALPRRQREVVALRFFLDLSVSDTASALQCSEGAVKGYTARALARMRELLDDRASTPDHDLSGGLHAQ
ncbi:MAG TPA: SigE family RNA polymerase sigma factor [Solirubrobacteraceae bacterium]